MDIISCPNCSGKNMRILVVEIWQKDRMFKFDEEGKLVEIEKKEPYFKDESYDSRSLLCLECKEEFKGQHLDEIETEIDSIVQ